MKYRRRLRIEIGESDGKIEENFMRHWLVLGVLTLALTLFFACGSDGTKPEDSMQKSDSMKSSEDWIRPEPVDVAAVDADQDGFVYQDPMDWNVLADEEGKCPKCGMFLKKVTIDEAVKNLEDNGFAVK